MLAPMLANRALLDLLRGWLTAAIAFVRGVRASRCVWGTCCPCRPLSWPATCPPVLRLVRIRQSRCLFGCACRRAPVDQLIARRGCTWACMPSRTHKKRSSRVVRSSRTSVASSARRDVTIPHHFCNCGLFFAQSSPTLVSEGEPSPLSGPRLPLYSSVPLSYRL
jgi:hypothetical protein